MIIPVDLISHTVGELLLHSLWKAAIIALILKSLLLLIPIKYAAARCHLSIFALIAITIWSIVPATSSPISIPIATPESSPTFSPIITASTLAGAPAFRAGGLTWTQWLFAAWLTGVAAIAARNLYARTRLVRLAATAPAIADERHRQLLNRYRQQFGIRAPISLLMSHRIHSPMTFGWIRPVIIFPTSLATGIPTNHFEAILAHELAHIIRFDFLVHTFISGVRGLLFFNPGVWWIACQIEQEREAACDDLASAMIGSPTNYLSAIAGAELHRSESPPFHPALGFTQYGTTSRIRRLLRIQGHGVASRPKADLLLMLVVGIGVLFPCLDSLEANQNVSTEAPHQSIVSKGLGTTLSAGLFWKDPRTEKQAVPLFRSVIILEKGEQLINPVSDEVPVFDAFPNSWALSHDLNLLDGSLPLSDNDSDGFTNREEFQAGTSPVDTDSRPSYLNRLEYVGTVSDQYPVRYAAQPDPKTAQLNSYTDCGQIRSTDLLKIGDTTKDQLFRVEHISDKAVTALFSLNGNTVTLPKNETVTLTVQSAHFFLPVALKESLSVKEGSSFNLQSEPNEVFRLDRIATDHCIIKQPDGATMRIPLKGVAASSE